MLYLVKNRPIPGRIMYSFCPVFLNFWPKYSFYNKTNQIFEICIKFQIEPYILPRKQRKNFFFDIPRGSTGKNSKKNKSSRFTKLKTQFCLEFNAESKYGICASKCWQKFFSKFFPLPPYRLQFWNNQSFSNNSRRSWPIRPIFELDWDIDEIILCTKFHDNWMSLSEIIVLTAGRTDTLTDSRVYSLFEYTKTCQCGPIWGQNVELTRLLLLYKLL